MCIVVVPPFRTYRRRDRISGAGGWLGEGGFALKVA